MKTNEIMKSVCLTFATDTEYYEYMREHEEERHAD